MTRIGFFSAVQDRKDHSKLVVRGRRREDLERLAELVKGIDGKTYVYATPDADYPFRMKVKKSTYARILSALALLIEYPNFKESIDRADKDYSMALHDTWHVMIDLEGDEHERHYAAMAARAGAKR